MAGNRMTASFLPPTLAAMAHLVAAAVVPGLAPFELSVACEVFGLERPELDVTWYEFRVCGPAAGMAVPMGTGFELRAPWGWDDLASADTVIVPGTPVPHDRPDPRLVDAVRRAHQRGARIVSFCSGVFTLAAAGVLAGRPAPTHWLFAEELARTHPDLDVRPDVLYVDAGDVLTSAGTAAGIDLALHIVRLDHGAEVANAVARRMVVAPHRDGGQRQFTSPPVPAPAQDGDRLATTLAWMIDHLDEPLPVDRLAARALMSPRSFARHFRAATGTTPHEWLTARRVQHAQRLLETTGLGVEQIARACGLGSASNLRLQFTRLVGVAPSTYRQRFRLAS